MNNEVRAKKKKKGEQEGDKGEECRSDSKRRPLFTQRHSRLLSMGGRESILFFILFFLRACVTISMSVAFSVEDGQPFTY